MKFNKVLEPEVALGRRGHPGHLEILQNAIRSVRFTPGLGFSVGQNPYKEVPIHWDNTALSYFFLSWKCVKENPRTYFIPKDFAVALAKMDPVLPIEYLPERFFGYIAFAEKTIFDDDGLEVQGGYVFIGPASETFARPERYGDKVIWVSLQMVASGAVVPVLGHSIFNIEQQKLSELVGKQSIAEGTRPLEERLVRLLINSVLYVNSVGADLVKLPVLSPKLSQTQKKKEAQKSEGIVNECTIPVTLVSWHYEKPRVFSVGSTFVETHLRWQRCGPGNSQLKLIWVKEHERHFKNEGEAP